MNKAPYKQFLLTTLLIFTAVEIHAQDRTQVSDLNQSAISKIFETANIEATLVVSSSRQGLFFVHNKERSEKQYSPASTFKIFNTLLGLDTGAIKSTETTFLWDGTDRGYPPWNKDHTVKSAFKVSCVWCYQELARKIGLIEFSASLAENSYGNMNAGQSVDAFWLNGDLKISAQEQIVFLQKFYNNTHFDRSHTSLVKAIMLEEKTENFTIHAKSGWTGAELAVGWYVGYLEKEDRTYFFAMNMKMDNSKQLELRKQLTLKSLAALGLL